MDPTRWGKHFWITIHFVALGYPDHPSELDKVHYKTFFLSIGHVLPCQRCADNYKLHLEELPIDGYLDSRKSLFEWTVKLHNIVNKEQGKDEWTPEVAMDFYLTGDLTGASSKHVAPPVSRVPLYTTDAVSPRRQSLNPMLVIYGLALAVAICILCLILFFISKRI
jgi:hypothetical protein